MIQKYDSNGIPIVDNPVSVKNFLLVKRPKIISAFLLILLVFMN